MAFQPPPSVSSSSDRIYNGWRYVLLCFNYLYRISNRTSLPVIHDCNIGTHDQRILMDLHKENLKAQQGDVWEMGEKTTRNFTKEDLIYLNTLFQWYRMDAIDPKLLKDVVKPIWLLP